jgi:HlyD family secretion protein
MQVDTNVSESDIGGIKLGDQASFTVDAFAKRIFRGAVGQIRQSPQTVQNVVTYDVVVSVDNTDLALKPGMTAATGIIVEEHSNVMRVPNAALRYRPGGAGGGARDQAQVWVLRDEQPVAVSVALGLNDESFTEIVAGDLKGNDHVIAAEQSGANGRTALPRFGPR